MKPPKQAWRRTSSALVTALVTALATALATLAMTAPAQAANVVTPGDFTGYGFDQCVAPNQSAMDRWLISSPYWAVGIYISGDSRGCLSQPNLSRTWVSTQLANGWRLLPITLGPQASCTTRERYLRQVRIKPTRTSSYGTARGQGRDEAAKTVRASTALGIAPGSTLWYDIEAFNTGNVDCRESALSFLSAWTNKMHALGYVSGIYSSAASGIKMLDDARATRPGRYTMPDQIWIADWNNRADVYSSYVRSSGWMPHKRVHQYKGGHNATYGGVTINIDSNWLDLGRGSVPRRAPGHCGVSVDFPDYPYTSSGSKGPLVSAAQCLLRQRGFYSGAVSGTFDRATARAVKQFRSKNAMSAWGTLPRKAWMVMLSYGTTPVIKYGSANNPVRRVQRTLNAAAAEHLKVTGVFDGSTTAAVQRYQKKHGLAATGVVTDQMWALMKAGAR